MIGHPALAGRNTRASAKLLQELAITMIRKAPETSPCSLISCIGPHRINPLVRSDSLVNRTRRFHKPGLQS
jgi:hypothetical protein